MVPAKGAVPLPHSVLDQDFQYGLLDTMIVRPTAPAGAVFFTILVLSDSGAAKEVVSLASSGHEKARIA